jgi:hypothetical protein
MGHSRIGRLPATRRWREVIALIGGGADVSDIAAATSLAAEQSLDQASEDPTFQHAFWLLTQIPLAARTEDFAASLRALGLGVSEAPNLQEICATVMTALDRVARKAARPNDLGEIAALSLVECLSGVAGRESPTLFGPTYAPEEAYLALRGLATTRQFGLLARDFFARLTRRCLDYFLSRELPNHVGIGGRFQTLRDHRDFEQALDAHCHETAQIVRDFAGEWFSKTNYEGGIDEAKAGRFAHVAFGKLRKELRARREINA